MTPQQLLISDLRADVAELRGVLNVALQYAPHEDGCPMLRLSKRHEAACDCWKKDARKVLAKAWKP